MKKALAEIDAWDEPNFKIAAATLINRFPSQYEYVFSNLKAKRGPESLISVKTFVDRVLSLLNGSNPAREDQRDQDLEAVNLLAQRGIDTDTLNHLLELLTTVEQGTSEDFDIDPISEEDIDEAFNEMKEWYDEWSTIARAIITRKDYLIALGLRKPSKKKPENP